jgi:enoyl-[acyl-carrier protein] reductase III
MSARNGHDGCALVTGGTRGIGLAIALRLVRDGARRVVLGYMRNDTAAEQAAETMRAAGAEPVLVRGEVSKASVVAELASHGPYRVVVHNAATGVIRPALETEDKHWDWTLAANARALLSLARATVPAMEEGGSILAISSLGSQRVLPNYVLVGTSKAALESVVRYLAFDLAPRGIRVNCVSAGVVDTEALDWFPNKEQMLASAKRTPPISPAALFCRSRVFACARRCARRRTRPWTFPTASRGILQKCWA